MNWTPNELALDDFLHPGVQPGCGPFFYHCPLEFEGSGYLHHHQTPLTW